MEAANATPETIKAMIRQFFSDKVFPMAGVKTFGDDESFIEKGLLDSTGVLELLQYLETTFAIRVADHEIVPDNLDSLNRLAIYVRRKAGETGAP